MSSSTVADALRKEVLVDATPDVAFRVFTEQASGWWPLASHSLLHEESTDLVFEPQIGGRVYERTADGREAEWGTILAWEPPARLALTWVVGEPATELEIRFLPEGAGTRVQLEHRGWEAADDRRGSYDGGWDYVLGRFVERIAA